MEDLLGQRVFVSTPWEGLVIARLEEANRLSLKRLTQLEKRKDPEEQLRQMKAYRDTDDRLIEECVTNAVAAALDDWIYEGGAGHHDVGSRADCGGAYHGDLRILILTREFKHTPARQLYWFLKGETANTSNKQE